MSSVSVSDQVRSKPLQLWSGTSKITVDLRTPAGLYTQPIAHARVKSQHGFVYLLYGGSMLEMTTPVAVKVGYALAQNGGYALYHSLWVSFAIDATDIVLLPDVALRLGGAILKKADRADDSQRRKF